MDALKARISRKIEPAKVPEHAAYPSRRGSKIFLMVDGSEIELHPLAALNILRAWQDAIGGAYVYKAMEPEDD
ncbi:hypothetical protein ACTJJ7_16190 [Phyllobacterium sp. 22229]|uniref:hypothetical protein n=1 Tax=Phyllobacterium sp. 22229 TaxID=3453895 RepID=UPI003F86ADF8